MASAPDATGLLNELNDGNDRVADELMQLVYEELRRLAAGYLNRERRDHTLQPTALVHEAYMKLVDQKRVNWQGETHFKAIAARAMRRILMDYGRTQKRKKRGGDWQRVALDDAFVSVGPTEIDPATLRDALEKMRKLDERQTLIVEFRLFGGLTSEETARALDVSKHTVDREWRIGQAWLRRELGPGVNKE